MSRIFLALVIVCVCAFTSAAHADATETLAAWQRVQDPDSGASFSEISDFLDHHPTWPDQKKIHIRAEMALRSGDISDNDIIAWFDVNPPISGVGKWLYAQALTRQHINEDKIHALVKDAWRDANLSESEENTLLNSFGNSLTVADHFARVDRLLWDGKTSSAQHLIPRLPVVQQVLCEARIALMEDKKTAPNLLVKVTSEV
jgi:soluble lytic murein transglycosylase